MNNISSPILNYFIAHPEVELTPVEIGEALRLDNRRVATSIRNCIHRLGRNSAWSHVERTARGVYVYRTEPVRRAIDSPHSLPEHGWAVVGMDAGNFILKSPDDRFYLARPLAEVLDA